MQVHSGNFQLNSGWSEPHPVALDSPQTLILVFGAKAFENNTAPFEGLRGAFPQSVIAGCSTSGEISGACVNDNSISIAVSRFEHTRLRRAIAHAPACVHRERRSSEPTHHACDLERLVEATVAQPPWRKRHWKQEIHLASEP